MDENTEKSAMRKIYMRLLPFAINVNEGTKLSRSGLSVTDLRSV
jgi:hypothetical protein